MKFQLIIFSALIALVSARGKSRSPSRSTKSGAQGNDKLLAEMYTKMKGASAGVAINLDSTFGGGRCNCICKDNN
jgi:hypothetical protein